MAARIRTTSAGVFTATSDWAAAPIQAVLWIGSHPLGADDFNAPETLEGGDSYTIPIGTQYNLTFTPDGGAAGSADDALVALMNAGADEVTAQFSLHDGAPGTNFAANELENQAGDEPGYARATVTFEVIKA